MESILASVTSLTRNSTKSYATTERIIQVLEGAILPDIFDQLTIFEFSRSASQIQ